jgi:hypothetical protein
VPALLNVYRAFPVDLLYFFSYFILSHLAIAAGGPCACADMRTRVEARATCVNPAPPDSLERASAQLRLVQGRESLFVVH